MAAHDHWMPFYVGDYLADTTHLSTLEHGAYLLVIFWLWKSRKPIPDTDDAFTKVTRLTAVEWRAIKTTILALLAPARGGWTSKRVTIELARAENLHKKRVSGGLKTARKRKDLSSSASADLEPSTSSAHAQHAVTTTTKVVRGNNRGPSHPVGSVGGEPPTDRPLHPDLHGFEYDGGVVCVHYPKAQAGVRPERVLSINANGGVDYIDFVRGLEDLSFRRNEAIALRQAALANPIPVPIPDGPSRKNGAA